MSRFYSLPVVHKKFETKDAISISFQVPDDLKNEFKYKQGQYLTLQMQVGGEQVRRAYSLCSCPLTDDTLTVTVKKVDGGKMSNYLYEGIQLGTRIDVMPPSGRFYTEMNASNKKHYILVGGGSGITPLISIIKTVMLAEPQSKCTLIYGNRDAESIIFREELDAIAAKYPGRLHLVYSLDTPDASWNGETGLLSAEKVERLIRSGYNEIADREYFLCGPVGLMDQVKLAYNNLALEDSRVHIEFFTSPTSNEEKAVIEEAQPEVADFEGSRIIAIMDGKEYELFIKDNTTILQAGIRAGIDPPFSCEAGICSTCMAKVLEGTVRIDENNILTADEVKKGFILTCQSHPTSREVRLEFYD